jgi:uncharacterized protein (TIGR03083 family)
VALLELLRALSSRDWDQPTICAGWSVKDVAAHLLAGDVGVLSRRRDSYNMPGVEAPRNYEELVALINTLNDTWVMAARRLSPQVLCDLLAWAGPQVETYFATWDPHALGHPVDWAGPGPAPNWLDLAREYTERWHHQQQIRDAVGRPGLKEPRYLHPVLDAFVRALPHSFRDVVAPAGTVVALRIRGDAGGDWFVAREAAGWELFLEVAAAPAANVQLDQDDAWRLFTKGLRGAEARRRVATQGDAALGEQVLKTIAILG